MIFMLSLVSRHFCLFLTVATWTMSLTEAYGDCSPLAVALGSFMTSWESGWCTLGVIMVSPPLLGSFSTVPSLLHLWIMTLTVVYWSPKALEMALELLIGVSDFVSKLLLYIMAFIYWAFLIYHEWQEWGLGLTSETEPCYTKNVVNHI